MKYTEFKLYTSVEKLDELVELFAIYEDIGIQINDPRDAELFKEPSTSYQWNYVDESVVKHLSGKPYVMFYVPEGEKVPDDLKELLLDFDCDITSAKVDDQDWLHKWEEYYVPTKISERFTVKPYKKSYTAKSGEEVIEIDPGMAFGTGTHPTSYLCVRLMEECDMHGACALDVGCGTGILSIAASKLGAADVMAVDLDPEAVSSTERNSKLNACKNITVREGDLTKGLDYKADFVLANLMADLVIMLTESVAKHCKPGATYISSGILDEKEAVVSEVIRSAGFEIVKVIHDGGWCAIKAIWQGK